MKRSVAGEKPIFGRDALFLAERLRHGFWRRHKESGELMAYKERITTNQRRAEYTNEVRRIEGFLQSNLAHQARKGYMRPRQRDLMMKMGLTALPE